MADCLFCKIRDGKIPSKTVHKDARTFAFEDIAPQAPMHLLVLPVEHVPTINDLTPAHRELVGELFLVAGKLAAERGYAESGYRTVMNCNRDAQQSVFHIHLHVLGGRAFTWPPG